MSEFKDAQIANAPRARQQHESLGVTVRPLTPEERRETGDSYGLLVQEAHGAAARAGIRAGDVILSLNAKPVHNARQLRELLGHAGDRIALLIERDGVRRFVSLEVG